MTIRILGTTYALPKATKPVPQTQLVRVLVVVGDGRDGHVPLVRDGPDRRHAVLHREVDVARARQDSLPAGPLALLRGATQSRHDQVLGMVVPPASGSEFGEDAPVLQQRAALPVRLLLLVLVVPVRVAEAEVRLARQGQHWDLVQDRLDPEALDDVLQVSLIAVAAGIVHGGEGDVDLFRGLESEVAQESEIGVVEVGAGFLQVLELLGGEPYVSKL